MATRTATKSTRTASKATARKPTARKTTARKTTSETTGSSRAVAKAARTVADLDRERQSMPLFVKQALRARALTGAYRARPPYQQNDYLMWINAAKREDTKQKRLAQMLAELEGGTRYMKMAWRPGRDSDR